MPKSTFLQNPLGRPLSTIPDVVAVKMGKGKLIHVKHPDPTKGTLCAPKDGAIRHYSKGIYTAPPGAAISCYRCLKLMQINEAARNSPLAVGSADAIYSDKKIVAIPGGKESIKKSTETSKKSSETRRKKPSENISESTNLVLSGKKTTKKTKSEVDSDFFNSRLYGHDLSIMADISSDGRMIGRKAIKKRKS